MGWRAGRQERRTRRRGGDGDGHACGGPGGGPAANAGARSAHHPMHSIVSLARNGCAAVLLMLAHNVAAATSPCHCSPVMYSQQWSPVPSTTASARELRT